MRSLLNALHDGRLVELPDTDKTTSLEYLAHLIEAVPEVGGTLDLAEQVLAQEQSNNTGIGLGVACPHVRANQSGELLCAVGWSPAGIEYGAKDGKKVHLVVMYYIPDAEKNTYLKEVSSLVRAVRNEAEIQSIARAEDIAKVRDELLDWVSAAIDASIPETKARMIRLEARQAAIADDQSLGTPSSQAAVKIVTVLLIALSTGEQIVLSEDTALASQLQGDSTVGLMLKARANFDRAGYHLIFHGVKIYDPARPVYEYLAIKVPVAVNSASSNPQSQAS